MSAGINLRRIRNLKELLRKELEACGRLPLSMLEVFCNHVEEKCVYEGVCE